MIGDRIKQLRLEKGTTQKDLADYLGLTPKMISFYENEKRFPPQANISKIAKYFNVTTDYLLGVSEVKTISEIEELKRLKQQTLNALVVLCEDIERERNKLDILKSSVLDMSLAIEMRKKEISLAEDTIKSLENTEKASRQKLIDIENKINHPEQSKLPNKTDLLKRVMPTIIQALADILQNFAIKADTAFQDKDGNPIDKTLTLVNFVDIIKGADFEIQLKMLSELIYDVKLNEETNTLSIMYKC